jgi:predicted nucleotidyltransferase
VGVGYVLSDDGGAKVTVGHRRVISLRGDSRSKERAERSFRTARKVVSERPPTRAVESREWDGGEGYHQPGKGRVDIRRIVEVAKPEKIILFGSATRGAMGPNSDVDLLVIKAGANRLDLMGGIYRNLHGVGEPVDVLVATPEDVE